MSNMTLEDALEEVSVVDPDTLVSNWTFLDDDRYVLPCPHPKGYWAVVDDTGIEGGVVAYFVNETLALRFRLDLVNRKLNG